MYSLLSSGTRLWGHIRCGLYVNWALQARCSALTAAASGGGKASGCKYGHLRGRLLRANSHHT
jgi:hypothetical protein